MTNARDKANIPVLNFQSKGIDDNADATAITINSSEQVGIGTASPDHLLHISASSSNAQLKLQRTGSATASYNISASSDSLAFSDQVAGTERMRLTSTGLGIGTSSPTHDLTVDGGTSTSVSLIKDATGAATVRYYDGGSQKAYIQLTSSEDMDFFAASGVDQIFYGNGAEVMRLSSGAVFNEGSGDRDFRVESNNNTHMLFVDGGTDRVGIGTSSPGAKLEINSTGNYYNTANQHQQWSYNGTPFLSLYMDAYASPYFDTDSASSWNPGATMVFKRQGSEKMRITSDGKVGIGDSAPLAKLQVTTANSGVSPHPLADELFIENSGDVGITLGSSTSGTGSIMFGDSGDPNRGRIRYHQSTDKMEFGTAGGSEKMVIDSGGRLLVGTSSAPGDTDEVVIVGQATANGKAGMSVKAPTNHAAGNGSAIVAFDFLGNNYYSSSGKWGIYYRFLAENDAGSYADRGRMHFLPGYDGNSTTGGNGFLFRYNGNFTSDADDVADLGSSSNRWDDVYATNGTIQTSDQNEKQSIQSLTTAEMNVGKKLSSLIKTFKWNSSVEEKGDNARTHTGLIAQQVRQAFDDESLDASKYGFWCSDTWYVNADGEEVTEDTEGAILKTRLGLRYSELFAFIQAYNDQRFTELEARITTLEANNP